MILFDKNLLLKISQKKYYFCYFIIPFFLLSCSNQQIDELKLERNLGDLEMPLQPITDNPTKLVTKDNKEMYYIPSNSKTVRWGYLPNASSEPILSVESGSVVVFDTVSHEGILEDQGRAPIKYFSSLGISEKMILKDAIEIASSEIKHDFFRDGPHVVTGPIIIENSNPGDVLMIEILDIVPRVPYGIISNRHGKGALPGEYPLGPKPNPDGIFNTPESYKNISILSTIQKDKNGLWMATMKTKSSKEIKFETNPFMGIMGVALNTTSKVHSVPPGIHGGNIDIKEFTKGSRIFFPVLVEGAKLYTGDPHMAQGNGEVALTALEQSLRVTLRVTLLKKGHNLIPSKSGSLEKPFGENKEYWIAIGLDEDLDEAMKDSVRESIRFLNEVLGIDKQIALAYLSAATDYEVSQVVDKVKGVHALIRKQDFNDFINNDEMKDL